MSNPQEAKRLYLAITGGTGVLDKCYGPHQRGNRAIVLSALEGRRLPQSQAGWNLFRDAMFRLFDVQGDHDAAREKDLRIKALAQ